MNISAVIMASGESFRMSRNKLLLPYKNTTLLMNTINIVKDTNKFSEIILVTTEENALFFEFPSDIKIIYNYNQKLGQSASIHLGIKNSNSEGCMFFVADQPFIDTKSIIKLISRADFENIVVPTVDGNKGAPVFFGGYFFEELLNVTGDTGGRVVRNNNMDKCVFVEVENKKFLIDIDTKEDYEKYIRPVRKPEQLY